MLTDLEIDSKPKIELPPPTGPSPIVVKSNENANTLAHAAAAPKETEMGEETTGWAPRFGWPADAEGAESLLHHTTWLESQLPDKFYGGTEEKTPAPLPFFPRPRGRRRLGFPPSRLTLV